MDVRIVEATALERSTLENLFELYAYDFSATLDMDVERDGRFHARTLDVYWTDPRRHPFLIEVGDRLAGFALIHAWSHLTGEVGWDVGEFFVLRRYRSRGVGARSAASVFDRFRGRWEVRQRAKNVEATAFWRKAIGRYTNNQFEEIAWNDITWNGPVQRFDNTQSP